MQRDMKINYDLENSPLQIKAVSVVGNYEKVRVSFFDAQGRQAGGVYLLFTSPPQYGLDWCTFQTKFPNAIPSETDKTWTITLSRILGFRRLVIACNDEEVLNVVISNNTCYREDANWSSYWSREVKEILIQFSPYDTASLYYRPGELNMYFDKDRCCN